MLSEKQAEMLNHMFNPKFFATMDKQGNPNLVVITCAEFYGGDIIFGNLFLWKTARNLKENPQVAMLVMDQKLNYFLVEGSLTVLKSRAPCWTGLIAATWSAIMLTRAFGMPGS